MAASNTRTHTYSELTGNTRRTSHLAAICRYSLPAGSLAGETNYTTALRHRCALLPYRLLAKSAPSAGSRWLHVTTHAAPSLLPAAALPHTSDAGWKASAKPGLPRQARPLLRGRNVKCNKSDGSIRSERQPNISSLLRYATTGTAMPCRACLHTISLTHRSLQAGSRYAPGGPQVELQGP